MPQRKKTVICGAAGRDFHNFNVVYRNDPTVEVVAFTAAQIPGIADRRFPESMAGPRYPEGIPIWLESELGPLCVQHGIDEVVFAYSDVTRDHVMSVAAAALAAGANFVLLGPKATMLETHKPTIAVCAVRTGCGKSQIARYIARNLTDTGKSVAVLRHPMPYGDLARQTVQRFQTLADLDEANCTIEEREEYEPHINSGGVVFAGVDYNKILHAAESEADIILWDGGNNDHPFIKPGYNIVVVDALRPTQLTTHYPGDSVLLRADLIVINKVDAASQQQVATLQHELDKVVPHTARVIAASPVRIDTPERLAGARIMIIEDGPTITHGGMPHGAGYQAVQNLNVAQIVDPREFATPEIAQVFAQYPHIGPVLPAMGYSHAQREAMAETIKRSKVDAVVSGSPIDLAHALALDIPVIRAHYDYQDVDKPALMDFVDTYLADSN
jgi:predicted GTPase